MLLVILSAWLLPGLGALEVEFKATFCVQKVVDHFERLNVIYQAEAGLEPFFEFSIETESSQVLTKVRQQYAYDFTSVELEKGQYTICWHALSPVKLNFEILIRKYFTDYIETRTL